MRNKAQSLAYLEEEIDRLEWTIESNAYTDSNLDRFKFAEEYREWAEGRIEWFKKERKRYDRVQ